MIPLLQQSCTTLKGVGPALQERLQKLGINTLEDLFFHLPIRYQDRSKVTPIAHLRVGDQAVVEGQVVAVEQQMRRRSLTVVMLRDESGFILQLKFFHFTAAQAKNFTPESRWRCFGEVKGFANVLEMVHPECQRVTENMAPLSKQALTPIYPSTDGVTQHQWRHLSEQLIDKLAKENILDDFAAFLPKQLQAYSLHDALLYLHRPPLDADQEKLLSSQHPAQQRLILEELVAQQMSLLKLRSNTQTHQAPKIIFSLQPQEQFLQKLTFKLTAAQERVVKEVLADMALAKPMMRLVQGDVGSGKTIVAALIALQVIAHNYQVALMAPTEILSEQHYQKMHEWFSPLGIEVVWLAGKLTKKARDEVLPKIAEGKAALIVGTHALFQESVKFANLGLVIIDEQHRFGVHQRLALRQKGERDNWQPHQLVMTATPIPRTLAMAAYADLQHSIIDELPPGRTPVQTLVLPSNRRDEILQRIHHLCADGHQIYWVCPLIEESELLQCQAAETSFAELQQALPSLRIALVHGRMKAIEKEAVMAKFKDHQFDVLVATTVIEVGVDVPNACLMVIENAERMGLAQLHQLRGRVGRGSAKSFCVLLYQHPLSLDAQTRLNILRQSQDGFYIAEQDLLLRGPGEILGTRQTGLVTMRIADVMRDQNVLPLAQDIAEHLLGQQPQLAEYLMTRWIGHKMAYRDA